MAARSETQDTLKKRAGRITRKLRKLYPEADCELRHEHPLELLIATILSAQSTDDTVNKVMPALFQQFPTARALADAPRETIEDLIHATGFFRQKAKSVQGSCQRIVEAFGGAVPDSMDALLTLPGVARKTANVVLGTAFGKNEGFVVDTHVGRLAVRLGLTWSGKDSKDAVKIERDLMTLFPRKQWTFVGHALVWHGRRVCAARKPKCTACTLANDCPSAGSHDDKTASSGRSAAPARRRRAKRAG